MNTNREQLHPQQMRTKKQLSKKPLCAAIAFCIALNAHANPENPIVVDGDADFSESENTFTVDQHSDQLLVNYDSFSIAENESVVFMQPGTESIAINRVTGPDASEIFGSLNANGQIFLINSNGIMFSESARINVGALGASTLDFNADSLDDDLLTFSLTENGGSLTNTSALTNASAISNAGEINAVGENAYVAFISPTINNSGSITAHGSDGSDGSGRIELHAADSAIITLAGDTVGIETSLSQQAEITNSGNLLATEKVLLSADSVDELHDTLISNSGLIEATGFAMVGGKIQLVAENGDIVNEGSINASAGSNGAAGEISVLAHRFAHQGDMHSDASGNGDAGSINVYTEELIVVTENAHTSANADLRGSGGDIRFYSETNAYFDRSATIEATGGTVAGDGGFVEVSGIKHVSAQGQVDTRAFNNNGETGTYLIDPVDITISATASSDGSFTGGGPFSWTATTDSSNILAADITMNLANNNVLIDTNQTGAGAGNIIVTTDIDIDGAGANSLTLRADNFINFNAGASIFDSDTGSTETGTITLNPTSNLTMAADATIDVSGGNLIIAAGGTASVTGISSLSTEFDSLSVAANGGLIDAGDTNTDFTTPGGIVLDATAGAPVDFETDIGQFYTNYNNPGVTLTINEADNIFIGNLNNSTGNINVTTTGGASDVITIADSAGVGIVTAGDLTLNTPGRINSNSVLFNDPNITAANLDISAGALTVALDFFTSVDTLDIVTDGADVTVADANGITLNSADVGSHDFILNTNTALAGGDIIINTPSITTNNFSSASHAGDIGILDAGLEVSGNISLSAEDLIVHDDLADRNLRLNSSIADSSLTIDARVPGSSFTLVTDADINSFDLSLGSGETETIFLTPAAAGIDITDIDIDAGLLDVTLASGDVTVSNSTAINDLAITVSNGSLILPDAGLTAAGNLIVDAEDLIDSDRDVSVGAGDLDIVLSALAGDSIFRTQAATFTNLNTTGANVSVIENGNFDLNNNINVNNQDLNLQSITGDITVTSINNVNDLKNLTLTSDAGDITIANNLAAVDSFIATAAGTISLQDAGISVNGDISLTANDIVDTSGRDLTLNSTLANSTLIFDAETPAANTTLTTNANIDTFDLSLGAAATETLVLAPSAAGITLSDIDIAAGGLQSTVTGGDVDIDNITNLNNLVLAITAGSLTVPDTGLLANGGIQVQATDLIDSDRTVTLTGTSANLTLSNLADASTFNTTLDNLNLTTSGGGISVTDVDGLTLDDADTNAEDLSLTVTTGDLVIAALTDVGSLAATATAGDIQIPDAGITANGDIEVTANDIRDTSGYELNFASMLLNSTLTFDSDVPGANTVLNSNANINIVDLALGAAATEQLTVNAASDGLTISDVDIANGELITTLATGDLSFGTVSNLNSASLTASAGDVIAPDAGLVTTNALTIDADDLRDSDRSVILGATTADLTLSNPAAALTVNTTVDNLDLTVGNANALTVVEADGLTLDDTNLNGDLDLSTTAGDITVTALTAVDDLSLTALAGDLILPSAGLNPAATLTLNAQDIYDIDAGAAANTITLSGTDVDLTASALTADTTLTTTVDTLALDTAGANITVNESDGFTLSNADLNSSDLSVDTTAGDITFGTLANINALDASANAGDLILPSAGLSPTSTLTLSAQDIYDVDAGAAAFDISLAGTDLVFTASALGADTTLNTSVDTVDLTTDGANVSIVDADNITLTDADIGAFDLDIDSTAGNIIVSALTAVDDLTLSAAAGDLILPSTGLNPTASLTLTAQDIVDADAGAAARAIILGGTAADITATALGGDTTFNTSVDSLTLTTDGANIDVAETDGFTLTDADVGDNDLTLSTTTNDLIITNISDVDALAATASAGDIQLPDAGITTNGDISLTANDIVDTSGRELDLNSTLANSTLTFDAQVPADDTTVNTNANIDRFDLTYLGTLAEQLLLNASSTTDNVFVDLNLPNSVFEANAATGDVTILNITDIAGLDITATNGDFIAPDAGINTSGDIQITANDIYDSDRTVVLNGNTADLTLGGFTDALTLTTNVDSLNLSSLSAAGITVNEADALSVSNLSFVGDISIAATDDLTIANAVELDGVSGANLSLSSGANLILGGDISDSIGGRDQDVNVALNASQNLDLSNRTIDAGAGEITLISSAGNVVVGQVQSDSASTDAIVIAADDQIRDGFSGNNVIAQNGGARLTANNGINSGDSAFETSVASLSLVNATAGLVSIANNQALDITTLNILGDANLIQSFGGDLTISDASNNVNGSLTIDTGAANSDLILTDAGLNAGGAINLIARDAFSLGATPQAVGLNANTADVSLNMLADDTQINTNVDSLTLNTNGANVTINEIDALVLTDANVGNHDLTVNTGADLDITALTAANNFAALSSGNIQLPSLGLTTNGDISLTGAQILAFDGGALNINSSQNNAQLTLDISAPQDDVVINTNANITEFLLAMTNATGEQVTLNSASNGFTLIDVDMANAILASTLSRGDIQIASITDLNTLDLTAENGAIITPDSVLTVSGDLRLSANDIYDSDRILAFAADTASIQFAAPADATTIQTQVNSLDISYLNNSALAIVDTDNVVFSSIVANGDVSLMSATGDLSLDSISANQNISLSAQNGQIQLPGTGLVTAENIYLAAEDIVNSNTDDTARNLEFDANQLVFNASNPGGDYALQTTVNELNAVLGGEGDLNINNVGDLQVAALGADDANIDNALAVNDGNIVLTNQGQLRVDDIIRATDQSADGTRAGLIDIEAIDGDIQIAGANTNSLIESNNTVGDNQSPIGSLYSNDIAVRIRTSSSDESRYSIAIGSENAMADIYSENGDILIESIGDLSLAAGSEVYAFDTVAGQSGGMLFERWTSKSGEVDAETGRVVVALAQSDEPFETGTDLDTVDDVISDTVSDNSDEEGVDTDVVEVDASDSDTELNTLLALELGNCSPEDSSQNSTQDERCQKADILKRFLNLLWIDGELPKL